MTVKNLKLAVCSAFVLGLAAFLLLRSDPVSGREGGDVASPTGVIASDGVYNNKVTIWWDAIRGATSYRIFRGVTNDPQAAIDVGSTAASSFIDQTATPGQPFFYWVRAENAGGVSALSAPDQGTRAATANQGPVPPLQPPPPPPVGNEITAAKAYLGKVLFWDEQMSSTRTVSCGTCHHSGTGGTDPRPATAQTAINPGPDSLFNTPDDVHGSQGVPVNNADGTYSFSSLYGLNDQVTGRRSVSYVNAGYSPLLFWDGRATGVYRDPITNNIVLNGGAALESQSAGPPASSAEMGHNGRDWNDVAARIAASKPLALSPNIPIGLANWIDGRTYPQLFEEVYGTADVSPTKISMAIATFERTLYSDQAPIDLDAAGIQPLTGAAQRGRGLFNGGGTNCNVCHAGNRFTDESFRDIGVRPEGEDLGRFNISGQTQDRGTFRVPSLRNVGLRREYFHNGEFTSLNQVVAFYNRGGDFRNDPNVPRNLIRGLGLNGGQQSDLVAFLSQALTDPRVAAETPPFDRPTLYTESTRVPQITGAGRSGSGGLTPAIKAISPPLVGNPNFTVSVSSSLGNAAAVLVIDSSDPGVGTTIPSTGSFAHVTTNTQTTGAGNGWQSLSLPIPNSAAIVGQTFFARWYVTDAAAANGFSVSPAARFTVFGEATVVGPARYVDFDGDGKTDISVFRPGEGNWYILKSSNSTLSAQNFGVSTDRLAPADYDGDGKTDVAVFRDGVWYMSKSRDGFAAVSFGQAGDIAQPGDWDGDGIADPAVFRPSNGTWYLLRSHDGFGAFQFGANGDRPVAGDFDGDGKLDAAVYRGEGDWFVLRSSGGTMSRNYGLSTDRPVAADYDGDGKAELAVFRPSNGFWYYIRTTDGLERSLPFGNAGDIASPGDYDGDGSNDLSVFRPSNGTWYQLDSASGFKAQQWGVSTDVPVPSMLVP
jgi:cytochrome c peroxidase